MKKRLQIIFLISLTYFFIIIPVQSQQQDNTLVESDNETILSVTTSDNQSIQSENNQTVIARIPIRQSGSSTAIQLENEIEIIQEDPTNDTGENIQIEEFISGSNNSPETQENIPENNFYNDNTGENNQINQFPELIISEVYYDGTQEWIEITNLGSDFSGEVELELSQSIFFPVFLQSNQSIILTKSSQTYSRISPLVIQQQLPLSFSFTDTKAIFIGLYQSGQILDIFEVDTGLVSTYNDKKTSITKQINNQIWFITGSNSAINVLDPYIASPGFFDFSGNFQSGDQNQGTGGSGNIGSGDNGSSSGSDLGGGGMSEIVDIPTPSSPQPNTLSITEIFYGTGQFSSFVEIKAHQDFSGKIFLTGSLIKSGFELDLSLEKNEHFIVVQIDNGWLSDQKKIEKPNLELNSGGYLYLLGQSGQVFDSIQVLSTYPNLSNYNGAFSNQDIDIFSKIDKFSPGFDEKYLVYSDVVFDINTGENNQNTGSFDQNRSGDVSSGENQNGQDLSGTEFTGFYINPKSIQIISLDHKNPESITIKSNIDVDIDISDKDFYLLSKETSSSERKITKKYLTGIIYSGQSLTISKTRGFLDKGSCIALFYKTGQIDQRCYGSALDQETIEEIEPEKEELDFIPNIQIVGVLPNSPGKDDKEEIHLIRNDITGSNSTLNTQNLTLNDKSLYLKTNSTKKYLTGNFLLNQKKIFIGSLGLVNKPACTELWYEDKLLDTYCYPQPQEGQYLQKGKENILETGTQTKDIPNIQIIGLLPNPSGKDDKEEVHLIRSGPETVSCLSESGAKAFSVVESDVEGNQENKNCSLTLLSKSLYLLNNKSKTYFSGSFQPNTGTIFKGSLGLLNKSHCTELRYYSTKLDRFCYSNPKEDQYFGTGNFVLQTIKESDFNILQKVGFTVTGSKICVSYYDQFLTCRSLPASKTSIKLKNENKLYKTYFSLLQNYLIKQRSTLYFNTDIKIYFDTFKKSKSEVSKFGHIVSISGQKFNAYDLSGQIQLTTASQGLSGKQFQDQKSWLQRFLIWLGL